MNFIHFVLKKQSIESTVFWAQKKLETLPNPKFESEFLIASLLQVDISYLRIHKEKELTVLEKESIFRNIKKRQQGIPAAYILGKKEWNNFTISVNNTVLIPRDETEVLVEKIKNHTRDFIPSKILDIGTGSGCITISLANHFLSAKFCAIDISGMALKMAKKNIRSLVTSATRISFWNSDLLDGILPNQSYQIIVANLPYVPTTIKITKEVAKEPYGAIFSGKDGLDLIRKLAIQLDTKKIIFKELWLEFLPESAPEIKNIFKKYEVEILNDISNQPFFALIKPQKINRL